MILDISPSEFYVMLTLHVYLKPFISETELDNMASPLDTLVLPPISAFTNIQSSRKWGKNRARVLPSRI